jgi:bacteriorhodopsin
MTLSTWTLAFRTIFVLFLVASSATTMAGAQAHGGKFAGYLTLLAAAEIGAALLFLFQLTRTAGLAALLAIFLIAFGLATFSGEMPLRFVYYAASAAFIIAVDRHIASEGAAASK